MEHITLLVVGLIICLIGASNMSGNIKTVHFYNRRKVKEEDIPKYGKAVGLGTLIIGLFMIAAFIVWKHRSNIGRLVRGEENRIYLFKKGSGNRNQETGTK